MPFNGSGTYSLPSGNPVVSGQTISSTTHNNTNNDIASALSTCITRNGQSPATANIPMGNNKLTGLAAATNSGDALSYGNDATVANLHATGTFVVDGVATLPGYITLGGGASAVQLQSQTAVTTSGGTTAYTATTSSPLATFTASITSAGVMTVTVVTMGTIVYPGMVITGSGIPSGSYVTGFTSGTAGDVGVYTTNVAVTIASTTVTGLTGILTNERLRLNFNASSALGVAPTLSLNGTTAKLLKQYDATGVKVPAVFYANQLADVEYDGTDFVVLDAIQPVGDLAPLGVTQSAGAMTIRLNPTSIDFRNAVIDNTSSSSLTTVSLTAPATLTIPATATLGTVSAVASKLLVLAINNGGTIELAVCNVWNNTNLNEATTINTTAISTGATSAVTNYSTTSRTGVYFRVIGELASTQSTAGTWASLPTIKSGGAWTPLVNQLTSGTSQASTSGTSIDFTSIPSWAKRITVLLNGVSTSGTSNLLLQLGSGTILTTGYLGQASSGTGAVYNSATTGFYITQSITSANLSSGIITVMNVSGNIWIESGNLSNTVTNVMNVSGGNVTLAGIIDRLRITTANGTDTFDAGSINIMYE